MGRYRTASDATARREPIRDAFATSFAGLVVAVVAAEVYDGRYAATSMAVVAAAVIGFAPAALTSAAVLRRRPRATTPADRVTLARAALASGSASMTVLVLVGQAPARTWLLFAVAVPTLLLDAVDGAVARRTDTVTEAGALLDEQVDAGVLLVLSLAAAQPLGAWVVAIGVARYAFVAASWVWPALMTPLPPSRFRKTVAGIQGGVLAGALAPLVAIDACRAAAAVALALLIASFASQIAAALRLREAH